MKRCEHCNVDVATTHDTCPLCFRELVDIGGRETPDLFKEKQPKPVIKHRVLLIKIFLFLSIIAAVACLTVNLMVKPIPMWSLVVIVSILYCWVLICHTILSERSIFEKLLLQIGVVVGLLFLCEWVAAGGKWMVDYVIPAISMSAILVLFILSQALKYHKGVLSFFIMTIILVLLSGALLLFKATSFKLLNIIVLLEGALSLLGMILFSGGVLKTEFSKKFHV
ncbi:MAG TPA: hypothetical protein DD621_04000 [Clostridiales bacterium]|nr:hypothetical protein [Clostridiales bacterium]